MMTCHDNVCCFADSFSGVSVLWIYTVDIMLSVRYIINKCLFPIFYIFYATQQKIVNERKLKWSEWKIMEKAKMRHNNVMRDRMILCF